MVSRKKSPGFMSHHLQGTIVPETKIKLISSLQVDADTVAVLKNLLEMARAGEIREITWAARDHRGGKMYGYAGRAYDDPLGIAGVVGKLQMALTCHGFNPCDHDNDS